MGFKDRFKAHNDENNRAVDKSTELQAMFTGLEKMHLVKYRLAQTAAAGVLRDDEEILMVMPGEYDAEDANCVLVVTDQRLVFGWSKRAMPGTATMRYEDIEEVQAGQNMKGTWLSFTKGSRTVKLEKSVTTLAKTKSIEELIREKQDSARAAARAESATVVQQASGMDELAKASELHKAGVLSDEEFAAMKAKVLGL